MTVVVMFCRDPEPQIIDFQTQQYKLFPLLATSYAYWFVGQKLQKVYYAVQDELKSGITVSLPEVCFVDDFNFINFYFIWYKYIEVLSLLWHFWWFGGQKRIQPVKVYIWEPAFLA